MGIRLQFIGTYAGCFAPANSEVTGGKRVDADFSSQTGISIIWATLWHLHENNSIARHLHIQFQRTKRQHQWLEQVEPIEQGPNLQADQTLKDRKQAFSFHRPTAMGEN